HIESMDLVDAPEMSGDYEDGDLERTFVVSADRAAWELVLLVIHPGDQGAKVETQLVCSIVATDIDFRNGRLNFDLDVAIFDEHEKIERVLDGLGSSRFESFKDMITKNGTWTQHSAFMDLIVSLNDAGLIPEDAID